MTAEPAPTRQEAPAAAPSLVQQFIPRELLAKLEAAQAGRLEGERRVVTMLFCDVKGSTAAASHLDPEEWSEIVNGTFERMIAMVYRYEGTVARLMGDGLLAFFGAPIAHEDDPQRAVLAGLDIVAAMRPYREQLQRRWGIDFDVRVGINTGLVVVGAVGSDLRLEYTALGDAINLAARMEQTAEPGTVQIAAATHKLIAPLFDFETLEAVEVKGREAPVRAYRVLGQKAVPGSLRGIEGLRAPLIGRRPETEVLRQAVEALQAGRGSIVSVMGEAGLGKSRLVGELRTALAGRPLTHPDAPDPDSGFLSWVEGRSLSYQTGTPYTPITGLLREAFGLRAGQPDAEQVAQLKAGVAMLMPGQENEVVPFLATLLGLTLSPANSERVRFLEPPALRAYTFQHLVTFFEQLAAARPLVFFLDDVHWIDPTSLELLEALLPITDRAPFLVIAAFRPRRNEPSWRFHETAGRDYAHRYTALALQPLDQDQARQLVASLLYVEDLPDKVRALILDKAEGNPFFVEEVIRSLLDAELVVRQNGHWRATRDITAIAVPDTLNGVIAARLDRLDDSARRVAQAAALLGRHFSYEALLALYDERGKLDAGLVELHRRELIREQFGAPHAFSFKHALTQEAAYNSILLSRRREMHGRAAEALERLEPDRAADIAHHFLEARRPAQAMPYLVKAGRQAAHAFASAEAIAFYEQALALLSEGGDLAQARLAYEGLGGILAASGQIPQALENFQAMLNAAEAGGDGPMQVSALNKIAATYALYMGQFQAAEPYLQRAERLGKAERDGAGVAEMSIIRCQMCTTMADFDGVIRYMDDVLQLGEKLGDQGHIALALEHVSSSLALMARFDEAWDKVQEALSVQRAIGDRAHEAWALTTTLPLILVARGDLEGALAAAEEGARLGARIGSVGPQTYGNWILAEIHRWRGEYEPALTYGRRALEASLPVEPYAPFMTVQPLGALGMIYLDISRRFRDEISRLHLHALRLLESPVGAVGGGTVWADLGWCAQALGDLEAADSFLRQGLDQPSMFMIIERPRGLTGLALVRLAQGRPDEALALVSEARDLAEARGMAHILPLVNLATGRIHAARGESTQALAALRRAAQDAHTMEMRPVVWQAHVAIAQLLAAEGQAAEAEAERLAAQAVVDEIASRFQEEDLRAAYLADASV